MHLDISCAERACDLKSWLCGISVKQGIDRHTIFIDHDSYPDRNLEATTVDGDVPTTAAGAERRAKSLRRP